MSTGEAAGPAGSRAPGACLTAADLVTLRTPTDGLDAAAVVDLAYRVYMQDCVEPSRRGDALTHDGERVRFQPSRFDHAFYTSATRKDRGRDKGVIAIGRVERLRWIVPVIAGQVAHTECWRCRDYRYRHQPESRLYIVGPEQYVVWLDAAKSGGFVFSSAYRASVPEIRGYIERQVRIWPPHQKNAL